MQVSRVSLLSPDEMCLLRLRLQDLSAHDSLPLRAICYLGWPSNPKVRARFLEKLVNEWYGGESGSRRTDCPPMRVSGRSHGLRRHSPLRLARWYNTFRRSSSWYRQAYGKWEKAKSETVGGRPRMRHPWNRQDPLLFTETAQDWLKGGEIPTVFERL